MNQTAVQLRPAPERWEISLHTAEYTALMARATSSVTIMFTVMAIGFAYLGYTHLWVAWY